MNSNFISNAPFWKKSTKVSMYLCLLAGAVFLALGINLKLAEYSFEQSAIPVNLVVTDMIANSKGNMYAPEFAVADGKHKGVTYRESTYGNPPPHQIGDQLQGFLDVKSGKIKSQKTIALAGFLANMLSISGAVAILCGFGLGIFRRYSVVI